VGEPVRPDHDSSPFEIAVVHVEQRDGGDVLDTEEIEPIAIMPVDAQPSRSQCRDEPLRRLWRTQLHPPG
jgi:hypothetical protein